MNGIAAHRGRNATTQLASLPVSGPGVAVNRGAEMAVQEMLKRTAPGSAGISGVRHDISWHKDVRLLVCVSGHP